MRRLFYILFITVVICHISCTSRIDIVESELSTSVKHDGKLLWTLNHDPLKGKPFFHPLANTDGTTFTDLPKTDHPWHRGLWFSWKIINGVNYWEEKGYTGVPVGGYTRLLSNERQVFNDKSIEFVQHLEYAPSIDSDALLKETRTIVVSVPDSAGNYTIDWYGEFTALGLDLLLDRTPIAGEPNAKPYGGYAGLSVRMNKNMLKGAFLSGNGVELEIADALEKGNKDALHGQSASWMTYQNEDGGSLLFMDHPSNLNYPSKWYISPDMPYFSPAVIYENSKELKSGESLKLSYRILVSPNGLNRDLANEAWQKWTSK
ncbi:PmoA family protein [Seonamhaeicola sp.]|uniref:DUF6807 domain-containing protein n=1 Tax=Seonamhaeicola sp. TaxID=1912245 RepID=UPI0026204D01|nr:PmoA family protein [Seonamhaeicola sp.]